MVNCRTLIHDQKGASELVALAIASVIGAAVIAATTTSFVELNKGQQNVTQTADALDIKREVEQMLIDPVACKRNFENKVADEHNYAEGLHSAEVSNRFPVNSVIPGFGIKIRHWNLSNGVVVRNSAQVEQIVLVNLFIDKSETVGGPKTIVRTVKLWTKKTGGVNSAIRDCYAVIGTGSDIWIRHTGTNAGSIYNSNVDGNVGVGTQTPSAKLQVGNAGLPNSNMRTTGSVVARSIGSPLAPLSPFTGNFSQTAGISNWVLGRAGFGTLTPAVPLDVTGSARYNGDLTIIGNLSAPAITLGNNLTVGTDLTATGGTTNLRDVVSHGETEFRGLRNDFNVPATFQDTVTVDGTFSVLGATLGTNTFAVTGTMVTSGVVSAPTRVNADRFCIGNHCRTSFSLQTCPLGTVTYRNNDDGTLGCASISCPANFFFVGMLPTDPPRPNCYALPTKLCPANEYMSHYDPVSTTATCRPIPPEVHVPNCATGYLVGVNNGLPICVAPNLVGGTCIFGEAVVDINSDGSPVCGPVFSNATTCGAGQLMTGIQSTGAPVCAPVATYTYCGGGGKRLLYVNPNRSGNCGEIEIPASSCSSGIRAISSTGAVTCI